MNFGGYNGSYNYCRLKNSSYVLIMNGVDFHRHEGLEICVFLLKSAVFATCGHERILGCENL